MVRSRSRGGEGGSSAKKEFLGSPPVANTDLDVWSSVRFRAWACQVRVEWEGARRAPGDGFFPPNQCTMKWSTPSTNQFR